MVIGNEGGVYAVGSGPLSGVILTKLLINLATGVAPQELKAPAVGRLGMPVPNPSTSSVRLDYEVTGTAPTAMEIYDPAGRMVTRLVDGTPAAGQHVAEWNARDVAKGVYFVRFKSGSAYATRKIVIE
jgi:type IX secretion system substrate protein